MKRYRIIALIMLATLLLGIVLTACNNNQTNDNTQTGGNNQDTVYTLQYTDDAGTHTLSVKHGDLYSLESVPVRNGYEFVGLYDSETGGTQYVNAQGSALAPFTDDKNMVLFPRWAAKEYTLVLDYQGAAVTGDRQMSVSYGSKLTNLPVNLTMANKTFVGWFTQPDKQGVQIADQYGVIPGKDLVTERNFDLSDPDRYVYLYAGFQGEMYDVTFYFGAGIEPETVKVEYGTLINNVVPSTRVNGMAVYKWSLKENDIDQENIFEGRITSSQTLYAAEYAPVIDFETYDGNKVNSLVLPAGSPLALPDAKKEGYKFAGWYLAGGAKYEESFMPAESLKLFAKYYTVLSFDSRGGSQVNEIASFSGEKIDLPKPEREGYIFAGWYKENSLFESEVMPYESTKLNAYWYKANKKKILITEDTGYGWDIIKYKNPKFRYTINLKEHISEVDWSKPVTIIIESSAFILHDGVGPYATKEHFWLYYRQMAEEQYLLDHTIINHANNGIDSAGKEMTWMNIVTVPEGLIYIALSADMDGEFQYSAGWRMYNYYWTIYYPDTSKLY